MPEGVNVEVDQGYARITFPDGSKRGPALRALLNTGAPIAVRTGGKLKAYIVPEGNAVEAGLIDKPKKAPQKAAQKAPAPKQKPEPAPAPPPAAEPPAAPPAPKEPAPAVKEPEDDE